MRWSQVHQMTSSEDSTDGTSLIRDSELRNAAHESGLRSASSPDRTSAGTLIQRDTLLPPPPPPRCERQGKTKSISKADDDDDYLTPRSESPKSSPKEKVVEAWQFDEALPLRSSGRMSQPFRDPG
eukprot:CAMPEP_0169265356 /NCGR_PEP_ID=MMETSP1016-20121227/45714_1 /TAXON_ID=342587 /ORGANISM="Karlodinium micrum, Strain CCMP2283" /LENGTH=125 /DNA_ID=CAMNT_0009348977 /DNA_START=44 /DNA_END=418 /DNA_ORIENTATION=-